MFSNSRHPRIHGRRRGFTLVEVLVTMALMAIVIPVVMRGMSVAMAAASTARRKAEAAMLGETRLNEIVSDIQTGQLPSFGSSGDFGAEWPGYSWSYQSVEDVDLGVTRLTLLVNWAERGQGRELELSTFVVDPTVLSAASTATQ